MNPIELWKSIVSEVNFPTRYNLTPEEETRNMKELSSLKRAIMEIGSKGGSRQAAIQAVKIYNENVKPITPIGDSFPRSDVVLNESIDDFMGRLQEYIRVKNYSYQTEKVYLNWIRKYIEYNGCKHPALLNHLHIEGYVNYLANQRGVALATQKQSFNAIMFVYLKFLKVKLEAIDSVNKSKKPKKLPVVLTVEEIRRLFQFLNGTHLLIGKLLYGTGLRVSECMSLRLKDIDFKRNEIFVYRGKGAKDRYVPLPKTLGEEIQEQIDTVREIYLEDNENGYGAILPKALSRKANYARDLGWYFLFSSPNITEDIYQPGVMGRYHLHESVIQRALRSAGKDSGILKRVYPHILRHSFATHSLANGTDIKTLQMILGHSDISTTEVYLHLADMNLSKTTSPLDLLE